MVLGALTLLAFAGFAGVSALSKLFHRQQQDHGTRWYNRGTADLQSGSSQRAVADFRTALLFSQNNYSYQLGLAEALAAQGRAGKQEAYVYLLDLWEREPENGTVNLALARILAEKGEKDEALRYYHNAIYALWDSNPDVQRRAARLELAEFLLRENATTQAQAELIALSSDLPEDPALHVRVGDLFMQAQDYGHALLEYRQALKMDRQNSSAMAGVGKAAFQLGNYSLSQRYLQEAVAAGADSGSAQSLDTVNLVLRLDPFRRKIPISERARIVVGAFGAAGRRLQDCLERGNSQASASALNDERTLQSQWSAMKPKITEGGLRRDPDAVEPAMDLVFAIERQTSSECGTPTGPDLALLLISKLHEGN
jgi:tetratricopeptide (TPR) repeat protein